MEKNKKHIWIWRSIFTVLSFCMLIWIFSNSLQTGEASAAQSQVVTKTVQKIFATFAPNSSIATAQGEAFDKLHAAIRTMAHLAEFALLGALVTGCYFSYTDKKRFLYIPVFALWLVPAIDEGLQQLTAGRAGELKDVLVDTTGILLGVAFAVIVWLAMRAIGKKRKQKAVK